MKIVRLLAYLVLILALIAGALIFTSANDSQVTVNYLLGEYTGVFSFILGMTFFLGFFFALILSFGFDLLNRTKLHFARKKIATLQAQINNLETAAKLKELD